MKKSIFLALLIYQQMALATTFAELSFEKQLEESSGAFEGRVLSKNSYKNKNGMIVTDFLFEVTENFNLSDDDIKNNKVIITVPGGTVNGVTSFIDSAPDFKIGDRNFLLVKNIQSKMYLSNFTLGKYNIEKNEKGEDVYTSEVFPMDPSLSKISKDALFRKLKDKKGIEIKIENSKISINKNSEKLNESEIVRDTASEKEIHYSIYIAIVLIVGAGYLLRNKWNDK